ncbi:MAG: hypothetical protein GY940_39810 [bacterium]|nr:hypothetical protein [bacterium]
MDTSVVLQWIEQGEDSKVQFKENFTNSEQVAAEMVAFSNSRGGHLLVGVTDKGEIKGLSKEDINRLNQLISNTATTNVMPPVTPLTEIVSIENRKIMVIEIKQGINKPYSTNKNIFYTKVGADKRKISREELLRLFQDSGHLAADEMLISNSTLDDLNLDKFKRFFKKIYDRSIKETGLPLEQLLQNLNLFREGKLNLAGLLLFGEYPERFKPAFMIKAASFFGNDMAGTEYRTSEDIEGDMEFLYKEGLAFLLRSLDKLQMGQSFNSLGILEISKIALEETLQNALIHRSYFKNAPIRLLVFDNRVEIISPGKLPNGLTVENIKYGNTVARNHVIASFASKMLPYRGLGTGVQRAVKEQPNIELIDDADSDQFIVRIPRPEKKK